MNIKNKLTGDLRHIAQNIVAMIGIEAAEWSVHYHGAGCPVGGAVQFIDE